MDISPALSLFIRSFCKGIGLRPLPGFLVLFIAIRIGVPSHRPSTFASSYWLDILVTFDFSLVSHYAFDLACSLPAFTRLPTPKSPLLLLRWARFFQDTATFPVVFQ